MRYHHHLTKLFTIATLVATPLTFAACGGSRQTYDPYFNDYHRWNSTEDGFYRRWEGETGTQPPRLRAAPGRGAAHLLRLASPALTIVETVRLDRRSMHIE